MTTLSSFTPEETELIVSLPYRVGMNVSFSEDEGGELDDSLELKALETKLREVLQKAPEASLIKEIAATTLESKDKWEVWSQGVLNVEPLCEKAVVTLKAKADIDEVKSYIKMCLDVAGSVAKAYGEFGDDNDLEESKGIIGKIMEEISKIMPGAKKQVENHSMNISASEDSAIERIREALRKPLDQSRDQA